MEVGRGGWGGRPDKFRFADNPPRNRKTRRQQHPAVLPEWKGVFQQLSGRSRQGIVPIDVPAGTPFLQAIRG